MTSAVRKKSAGELIEKLRAQRIKVDANAIHFISQGDKSVKADARNSVFKLSQRFQKIADVESAQKIKQILGKVKGEDEASDDDEWGQSKAHQDMATAPAQEITPILEEKMLEEMQKIEEESTKMADEGIITQEALPTNEEENKDSQAAETEKFEDEDEDEEYIAEESYIYQMQKDFMKQNLSSWYLDMAQAYKDGVKLVKVNAFGNKFIRVLYVNEKHLRMTQAHTRSQVKMEREIEIDKISEVIMGKGAPSREFKALESLASKNTDIGSPSATLCTVLLLPNHRSLSLIFLEEERRNGFVFFLRTAINQKKQLNKLKTGNA